MPSPPIEAAPLPRASAPSPSPADQAAFAAAPTIYVAWRATAEISGVVITVDSIEEKRDLDGLEVLRVELTARAGAETQQLSFGGERGEPISFAGYWVQLRGGSREAVGLAVIRASSE